MKNKLASMALITLLLVSVTACSDTTLQKVSKDMLIVATTVGTIQDDVIAANTAKLISDKTTADILGVCQKVNVAGKQVNAILASISKIDPASKSSLLVILTQVSNSLDPTQLEFVAGIKDPGTKQKIEGGLVVMRTALSGIQLILAGGK